MSSNTGLVAGIPELRAAIRNVYANAWSNDVVSGPSVGDVQELVLSTVYKTLQECAREHNARGPVATRVPNELLVDIFSYLPSAGRIATSRVCHAWRSISLGSQRLWSFIEETNSPKYVEAMLCRSGHTSVTVESLLVQWYHQERLSILIKQHLYRMHDLCLDFFFEPREWWDEWDAVFSAPAPQLRSLTLRIRVPGISAFRLRGPLFSNEAPNLRVLRIQNGCCDVDQIAGLSTLEEIFWSSDLTLIPDISKILQSFPRLQSLHISCSKVATLAGSFSGPPVCPPPSLKQLSVRMYDRNLNMVSALVSAIDCSKIPVVYWITNSDILSAQGPRLIKLLFKRRIQSVTFIASANGLDMRIVDSIGLVRVFTGVCLSPAFIDGFSSVFSAVPELTLVRGLRQIHNLWTLFPGATVLTIIDDWGSLGRLNSQLPCEMPHAAAVRTIRYSPLSADPPGMSKFMSLLAFLHSVLILKRQIDRFELHGFSCPDPSILAPLRRHAHDAVTFPDLLHMPCEERASIVF